MAKNPLHTRVPAYELVRRIQHENKTVTQWGQLYFSEDLGAIKKQIWDDLQDLTQRHIDSTQPCKVEFDLSDNPTASFTFYVTADQPNTITWRVEKRTKIRFDSDPAGLA